MNCPYCKSELYDQDRLYLDSEGEPYCCEYCVDDWFLSEIKYNERVQITSIRLREKEREKYGA